MCRYKCFLSLPPSRVRLWYSVSVCQRFKRKVFAWFFIKHGGKVNRGPRKKLLHTDVDPNQGVDTLLTLCDGAPGLAEICALQVSFLFLFDFLNHDGFHISTAFHTRLQN